MKLKFVTTTNVHHSVIFFGSIQMMPAACSTESIFFINGQSTWIIQWLLKNGEWYTFMSVLFYSINAVILQMIFFIT